LETWHIDDATRTGRLKTPTHIVLLIIQVVTTNSTTRGWPCLRIAQEVSKLTPNKTKVSASTVYRTLIAEGYGSFTRTMKPGLNDENIKVQLA